MTLRTHDLLIVGELNVDILVTGDVEPVFGQVEKLVEGIRVTGGGSAAITAVAAARLGLDVLYASIVGDDLFGHLMLDNLRAAGVDVSHVVVDPRETTGATIHLLRPGGDRAMLTHLGSIAHISTSLVDPHWYDSVRHLHVASPFLLSSLYPDLPAVAAEAKRHGMTVSMDTNWDPAGRWDVDALLAHVDILLPNEAEAREISGMKDIDEALDALVARVPVVAVKQGMRGATGAQGTQRVSVPAFRVAAVDATGAGDTFDAGIIAAWLRGATLAQAITMGSACAALSTTAYGGLSGQPDWATALALIADQAPDHHAELASL